MFTPLLLPPPSILSLYSALSLYLLVLEVTRSSSSSSFKMADEIELNMGRLDLTRLGESSIDRTNLTGEDDNDLAEDAHEAASSDDEAEDSCCGASDGEYFVPVTQLLAVLETSRKRKRKLESARSEIRALKQRITALGQERSAQESKRLTVRVS